MPGDKAEQLTLLQQSHRSTVFVGDGINDAPVLVRADVGIAMGLGTDTAIESADVVLVRENLTALPAAIRIARRTVRKARENIAFALTVKLAVLLLGAMGLATMWMAVFADVGVSILAILNSRPCCAKRMPHQKPAVLDGRFLDAQEKPAQKRRTAKAVSPAFYGPAQFYISI